ncbi:hypothetical protein TraAM80_04539 [Trypanosoma rangeli]|uniref:Chorein N-terminal domain-containing protein n=1 Tax=Trypanosoma rangeli TaxID=5698 RepID=A0A3R7LXT9_TRYRA|nr:uncharacterized protein TraAM80_04539 [Trypanosoma rangeli]RNF05439.1 hypothetical protein TraAM80_04539 [Trypanosoma rangeli]|eukprot:RNF05439.1 hypothetical protein TraAM80_04539 [Trypanosoma rangeli]
MTRPIHVRLQNFSAMLFCDSQSEVGFELTARELVVEIEPVSRAGAELLKVAIVTFAGVAVHAHATNAQKQKIVGVNHFSIRITSVYSSMGVLRRRNTAIIVDGVTSVFLDEGALRALTRCAFSHRLMMEVPDYCRPFRKLLQLPSRWPYAKSCVLAFIRERRRRYNFNASHLHFYAEARASYLALLEYCHRTRDIAEERESLAEVEADIRYRDVVQFLRRRVRERYSSTAHSSDAGTEVPPPAQHADAGGPVMLSSLHVEAKITCVHAPAKTTVWLREVALVSRHGEFNFSVGRATVDVEGTSQQLQASDAGQSFLSFQRIESNGTVFFRTKLEELSFTATSAWALQVVQPFMVAAPDFLLTIPHSCDDSSAAPASPTWRECTTSVIFPLVHICLDDLQFHLERLSLTFVERKSGASRVGFLLKELHVRFGEETVVLSPMKLEMTQEDDIVVSAVRLNVSNGLWEYLYRLRRGWSEALLQLHKISASAARVEATQGRTPTRRSLAGVCGVTPLKKGCHFVPNSQRVCLLGAEFTFEPLRLTLQLGRADIWYAVEKDGFSSLCAGVSSFVFTTDYVDGGVLTALLPHGIQVSTRSQANGAVSVAVSVGELEVSWRASTMQPLLHVVGAQANVGGDAMCGSAQEFQLLGAATFAPINVVYRRELRSIPATTRPYLASSLQVFMCLAGVCMDRLAFLELDLLGTLLDGYATFVVDKVVSIKAYRLFFSGFSNIAFSVSASSCPVTLTGTEAVMCRISMPPVTTTSMGTSLRSFGELLPELRETSPLTLVNTCEKLLATINVPCLEVEVFHCRFASIRLRGNVCSFTATLPIAVEEFWDDDVRMMERPSVELVVPSIKLNAADVIRLELEGVAYTKHSVSSLGESGGAFSDYEADSDTPSAICEATAHAEVKAWNMHLNGLPEAAIVRDMLGLWQELGFMVNSLSRRKVVTCDLMRGEQHDLSRTGPWFFDAPGKVVLVETCTFVSRASGTQMVVCSGTHVYFRHCQFSPCFLQAIAAQDESASFVCDSCVEVALGSDTTSVTAVRAEAEKEMLQKTLVTLHRSVACMTLPGRRTLALSLSTVELRLVKCLRKTVCQMRVQRGRLGISEEGTTHGLISRMDLDVDWSHGHKDDYATLSSAVRIDGVSIPISLLFAARSLQRVWSCKPPVSGTPMRYYSIPLSPRRFPFAKWKVILTTSVIPVVLCLPGGAPFMHFVLAATSLLSRGEVAGEAFVEARLGIQQISLWEFSSQAQVPLLRDVLTVMVVARTHDLSAASCDVSVSPCELYLSSEQIKGAASLLAFIQSNADDAAETAAHAMELVNRLGVEVILQGATQQLCLGDCLTFEKKTLPFPDCLRLVGGKHAWIVLREG